MKQTRMLVLTALFAALTAIGGFLKIPTPLSAVTLQFLFTVMAGVLLGPKWGALSQGVYVALGLAGLPVFTSGGGLSYLVHPTCGFLFGMIAAAAVVGTVAGPGVPSPRRVFLAGLAGLAVLYLIGLPYMYAVMNLYLGKGMTAWAVFRAGCLIFLPGDFVKLAVAAAVCPTLEHRLAQAR